MAKTSKVDKGEHLSFERALAELDQIVAKLEKGGLSLNESLSLFEAGVKSARFLREELDRAEKKVEILLKNDKGGMKRKPFKLSGEGSAGGEPGEGEGPKDDDDSDEETDSSDKDGGQLPF
jgi:exodeoxyribonuclease VII small subunit